METETTSAPNGHAQDRLRSVNALLGEVMPKLPGNAVAELNAIVDELVNQVIEEIDRRLRRAR